MPVDSGQLQTEEAATHQMMKCTTLAGLAGFSLVEVSFVSIGVERGRHLLSRVHVIYTDSSIAA